MMLPLTNNFSKLLATLALGTFYLGSFYLLTFVLKFNALPIVYATGSGIDVFLAAILSYFLWGCPRVACDTWPLFYRYRCYAG